jgi:hypothetical protein
MVDGRVGEPSPLRLSASHLFGWAPGLSARDDE